MLCAECSRRAKVPNAKPNATMLGSVVHKGHSAVATAVAALLPEARAVAEYFSRAGGLAAGGDGATVEVWCVKP